MREPLKDRIRLEHIVETATHKSLIQTASRMKEDGLSAKQIARYTGLSLEEIEQL